VRDGEGIGRGTQDGIRREHSNIGGNPVGGGLFCLLGRRRLKSQDVRKGVACRGVHGV